MTDGASLLAFGSGKIQPGHLKRQAIIYVRQSSPKQVRENAESVINQRQLVERAAALGWHRERIVVLDGDLGQSAAQANGRDDFRTLAAEVALSHVGIVFGWDVSRLARNNADWYHLLDLAALFATLIADVEGVYDPRSYNDRLLLGLKGTMSEAELHMLHQRLNAGRLSKVERGEYVQMLPTGLTRLADGRVVKDPDQQVIGTIAAVFAKFEELGSVPRVLRYFRDHGVLLPRRQIGSMHKGELLWRKPSHAALYEMLTNPAYAGAFAYGRRVSDPTRRQSGRPATGSVRKPMDQWLALKHGAYPAFISWEQYTANQAQLQDNRQRYQALVQRGRGTPGQGAALLQGLATCGKCGHSMKVTYKPGVRYVCYGLAKEFGERACAHLDGPSAEACVEQAFFEAIRPAQLDALAAVLTERRRDREQVERQLEQQCQRATYQVHLARRRYEAVDPDNRLVAAELEQQWEQCLVAERQAAEALRRFSQEATEPALDPQLRHALEDIGRHLPDLWATGRLSNAHKKQLLRSLIARVILTRTSPDRVEVKIVWVSGHFSVGVVVPPIWRQVDVSGYQAMVGRIKELWQEGRTDAEMAEILTSEGHRSARSDRVSAVTVLKIRNDKGWMSRYHEHRLAEKIDGQWTIHGLAEELGMHREWFYDRIRKGLLRPPDVVRRPPYGNHLIRDDPELIERLRAEADRTRQKATKEPG